jgi:hypothetical protein
MPAVLSKLAQVKEEIMEEIRMELLNYSNLSRQWYFEQEIENASTFAPVSAFLMPVIPRISFHYPSTHHLSFISPV